MRPHRGGAGFCIVIKGLHFARIALIVFLMFHEFDIANSSSSSSQFSGLLAMSLSLALLGLLR